MAMQPVEAGDVGVHKVRNRDGSPCCAWGWYHQAKDLFNLEDTVSGSTYERVYVKYAAALDIYFDRVSVINDTTADPALRAEMVNVALAAIGAVEEPFYVEKAKQFLGRNPVKVTN